LLSIEVADSDTLKENVQRVWKVNYLQLAQFVVLFKHPPRFNVRNIVVDELIIDDNWLAEFITLKYWSLPNIFVRIK
jgi:hypothetical protein